MAAKPGFSVKGSEPAQVDSYMRNLKHPLADVVGALRRIILSTNSEIGEEGIWREFKARLNEGIFEQLDQDSYGSARAPNRVQ